MNKMKEIRHKEGITLAVLSKKTKISSGYIAHLELGTRSNPSKDVMEKIAIALKQTVSEVFFSEVEANQKRG